MTLYQEFSNEHHPPSLAHHYVAYRAHVRAKVACLRYGQGDHDSEQLARTYHDLALHHLERGRLRMVVVGGSPGVGKSTLAEGIAEDLGYTRLVSDEIRKDITATPRTEHRFAGAGEGIYDEATTNATYAELLRQADLLLRGGHGVVLDASWARIAPRQAARAAAEGCGAEYVEFECVLPTTIARDRIARRMEDPDNTSDATPELVETLADQRDAWPGARTISTQSAPAVVIAEAMEQLTASTPGLLNS